MVPVTNQIQIVGLVGNWDPRKDEGLDQIKSRNNETCDDYLWEEDEVDDEWVLNQAMDDLWKDE